MQRNPMKRERQPRATLCATDRTPCLHRSAFTVSRALQLIFFYLQISFSAGPYDIAVFVFQWNRYLQHVRSVSIPNIELQGL